MMDYFRKIVLVAAIAGLTAGIAMTVAQHFVTVPMILEAESFEEQFAEPEELPAPDAATADGRGYGEDEGVPAAGFERVFFNFLANAVTGIGFALLLVAASELLGGLSGWRQGVFWGLAGFTVFTLAPGLGLPPELPVMPAADVAAQQLWWIGAVVSTAVALWLLFYRRSLPAVVLAFALLVLPHAIGAPQPASYGSPIPKSLQHNFIVAVATTTLVFWGLLGGIAGFARQRVIGHA